MKYLYIFTTRVPEENYKKLFKMKLFTYQNELKTSALEGAYAISLIYKTHATYVVFA